MVQALNGQCQRLEADIKQREDLVAKIDAEYRQSGQVWSSQVYVGCTKYELYSLYQLWGCLHSRSQDKEQAEELYLSSKRMLEEFRVPEIIDI